MVVDRWTQLAQEAVNAAVAEAAAPILENFLYGLLKVSIHKRNLVLDLFFIFKKL